VAERLQFSWPFTLAGVPGWLYVSSGRWDDHLEMVLPLGFRSDSPLLGGLLHLPDRVAGHAVEVRFFSAPQPMLSLVVSYDQTSAAGGPSTDGRLLPILAALVRAEPRLDFGQLLAQSEQAAPAGESATAPQPDGQAGATGTDAAAGPDGEVVEPGVSRAFLAARLSDLAWQQSVGGQPEEALRTLETALRYQSDHRPALELREHLKVLQNRELRRRRHPQEAKAHLEVGFSYLLFGRREEARQALRRATELDPRPPLAHLLLGVALHGLGQPEAAAAAYLQAARLNPDDTVAADLIGRLARGEPPPPLMENVPSQAEADQGAERSQDQQSAAP
jgi:tetratricopeptide (TPR) repeat protein